MFQTLRHPRAAFPIASPVAAVNLPMYAYVSSRSAARRRLVGISADFSASVSAVVPVTMYTAPSTSDGVLVVPGLVRGSTDTKLASVAFTFIRDRTAYHKDVDAVGVDLAPGTIPADKWGLYLVTITSARVIATVAAAANFTTGYDSEVLAEAAIPDTPSDVTRIGYITVLTNSGNDFIGGTDSLAGGASGNVATTTNYNDDTAVTLTQIGAPFRWDFTTDPFHLTLPAPYASEIGQALVLLLAASSGVSGRVSAWVS